MSAIPLYVAVEAAKWGLSDVTISAKHCGQENAWYQSVGRHVTMCDELFDRPLLTIGILHHEMAHAWFDHYDVPVADEEMEADELSCTLMLTSEERVAVAQWFMASANPHRKGDPHPGDLDRAAMYLCIDDGLSDDPMSRECSVYARSVQAGWQRTLEYVFDPAHGGGE